MNFESFERELIEALNDKLGMGAVEIVEVQKNNGVIRKGITLKTLDNNCACAPVVYLEKFFEDYNSGKSLENITNKIFSVLKENSNNAFKIDFFKFETVKDKICFKLINSEKNKELLENAPHRNIVGDLTVIYEIVMSGNDCFNTTIIKRELMCAWGIEENILWRIAQTNTPKIFPYKLKNLMEELFQIPNESNMYILSNISNIHGASCILYPELLKDFKTAIGGDFYIIPSSIHECILIPKIDDVDGIKETIEFVNENEVSEEEFLSDHLYGFDGELTIII